MRAGLATSAFCCGVILTCFSSFEDCADLKNVRILWTTPYVSETSQSVLVATVLIRKSLNRSNLMPLSTLPELEPRIS